MPKTVGGLIGFVVSSLLVVMVGLFVVSRIPGLWTRLVQPA